MPERYRRWFEYEKDAHAKVLASLETVPAEARRSEDYGKALGLLAHIVAARRLWLYRFEAAAEGPTTIEELFPKNVRLEDLSSQVASMHEAWTAYLAALGPSELDRVFEYESLEGDRYRNRVEDILTQLFGHSWYHRGQIAVLVRSLGGEPAVTDFVYWTRETLPPRPGAAP